MAILPQIVEWSTELPQWQQDALRRLVEKAALDEADLNDLVILCKSEHGIDTSDEVETQSLSKFEKEGSSEERSTVKLLSVSPLEHVNALRNEEELTFSDEGITVIYGRNAAGKSGYVRILRQLCRVRGHRGIIYPNVYSEDTGSPSASVRFHHDTVEKTVSWRKGDQPPPALREISIFDSKSASVYVTEASEIAYLPYGMDLLPRLAQTCDRVRDHIKAEIESLEEKRNEFESITDECEVRKALDNLSGKDAKKTIETLRKLSSDEKERLSKLRKILHVVGGDNPKDELRKLRFRHARFSKTHQRLTTCDGLLSDEAVNKLREVRTSSQKASEAYELAKEKAFKDAPIPGVGNEAWRLLWESARDYSTSGMEPSRAFPPEKDDRCVLCHQTIDEATSERMQSFEDFILSDTGKKAQKANTTWKTALTAVRQARLNEIWDNELEEELNLANPDLHDRIEKYIETLKQRQTLITDDDNLEELPALEISLIDDLKAFCDSLEEEVATTAKAFQMEERKELEAELTELEAREALNSIVDEVHAEIDRLMLVGKLEECNKSADTHAITLQNSRLTESSVIEPLEVEFSTRVTSLSLEHLKISLKHQGQKGKTKHELQLASSGSSSARVSDVLSEGEHRCVALAAFFAEIALQDSSSTVVFDDPVSSLDHDRRTAVAASIVEIASQRPVIVFTHDLVFMQELQTAATDKNVSIDGRHVWRRKDAGIITNDWPWDGLKVKNRLHELELRLPRLKELYEADPQKYDAGVRDFYDKLRTIWELAVEERLFNGAVHRYQREVKTQYLSKLHKIEENHIKRLEAGMTKASKWIEGHDHAAAIADPVPDPDELRRDLEELRSWSKEVRKLVN